MRPFTVDEARGLAYTTATGFLGFQVSSLRTGRVLYTIPIDFPWRHTLGTPSHGIALTPDGRTLAVIDVPNSYVHVFDVSRLPPRHVADVRLTHSMRGHESPCGGDCGRAGWLQYGLDGRFLWVADDGNVVSSATNRVVGVRPRPRELALPLRARLARRPAGAYRRQKRDRAAPLNVVHSANEFMSADTPQTWHHGLVADWWAEFNTDGPEIDYFGRFVEGRPAGARRGVRLRAAAAALARRGYDVDGCDASADMVARCRDRADARGLDPTSLQPLHELDPPRRYRTIVACGVLGLGSTRAQDQEALRRIHDSLEPGGTLVLDNEVPYANARRWPLWTRRCAARPPRDLAGTRRT